MRTLIVFAVIVIGVVGLGLWVTRPWLSDEQWYRRLRGEKKST